MQRFSILGVIAPSSDPSFPENCPFGHLWVVFSGAPPLRDLNLWALSFGVSPASPHWPGAVPCASLPLHIYCAYIDDVDRWRSNRGRCLVCLNRIAVLDECLDNIEL